MGRKKRETKIKIKKEGTNGDLEAHIRSKTYGDWGAQGVSVGLGVQMWEPKTCKKGAGEKKHERKKKEVPVALEAQKRDTNGDVD